MIVPLGDFRAEEGTSKFTLLLGFQLAEVRQAIPFALVYLVSHFRQAGGLSAWCLDDGGHAHHPLHVECVTGQGADVRIRPCP